MMPRWIRRLLALTERPFGQCDHRAILAAEYKQEELAKRVNALANEVQAIRGQTELLMRERGHERRVFLDGTYEGDERRSIFKSHVLLPFLALVVLSGCIPSKLTTTPTRPAPTEAQIAEWRATCTAIWREELDREIDAPALDGCVEQAKAGGTDVTIRENVRQSEEYRQRIERIERERQEAEEREKLRGQLRGRLHVDGTRLVDAEGRTFNLVGASLLSILSQPVETWAAVLDDVRSAGFNTVRVFSGALNWNELTQTPEQARERLPKLIEMAAERGIYVLVTAVTDSGTGYDVLGHVTLTAAITRPYENVLFEVGNELYHGTQSSLVNNMSLFCTMVTPLLADYPNPWALGAAAEDAPVNGRYGADCGTFNTVHVGRGGSADDIVARLTGLAAVQQVTGKYAVNSEGIGAGEFEQPGRRSANPEFFGRFARRSMTYGVGAIFHSEDGVFARPWGPVQRQAARAFVQGYAGPPEADVPAPTLPEAACAGGPVQILECERAQYLGRMSEEQLVDFLRASARRMNTLGVEGGPFGLLVKTGGTQCVGYSCDILCSGQGAAQRQWDVLGDVDRAQTVNWSEVMRPNLVERVCEVQ